jgi:hypothetical protein
MEINIFYIDTIWLTADSMPNNIMPTFETFQPAIRDALSTVFEICSVIWRTSNCTIGPEIGKLLL